MWDPRRLTTLWTSTACYRDSIFFFRFKKEGGFSCLCKYLSLAYLFLLLIFFVPSFLSFFARREGGLIFVNRCKEDRTGFDVLTAVLTLRISEKARRFGEEHIASIDCPTPRPWRLGRYVPPKSLAFSELRSVVSRKTTHWVCPIGKHCG
jgi:hypothetical protein